MFPKIEWLDNYQNTVLKRSKCTFIFWSHGFCAQFSTVTFSVKWKLYKRQAGYFSLRVGPFCNGIKQRVHTISLCNFFSTKIVAFYRIASRRLTGLLGFLAEKKTTAAFSNQESQYWVVTCFSLV